MVRLGTSLFLAKFGIVGIAAEAAGLVVRGFVGVLIEDGTFTIDVAIDAYREGKKIPEFEKLATEAWTKATAKVHTEKEKDAIRKQYLDIIGLIGSVGDGLRKPGKG